MRSITFLILLSFVSLYQIQGVRDKGQSSPPKIYVTVSSDDPEHWKPFMDNSKGWKQRGINKNCIIVQCINNGCPPSCGPCNKKKNMCTGKATGCSGLLGCFGG